MTDSMPFSAARTARAQALHRIAEEARSLISTCSAVGVTVPTDDPVLVLGTSFLAADMDRAQWDTGEGPSFDAFSQFQVFNVADLVRTRSWARFTRLATARGIMSTLAVPVTAGGRALGVLDLYSRDPNAFEGREPLAVQLAARASAVLAAPLDLPGGPSLPSAGADAAGRELAVP